MRFASTFYRGTMATLGLVLLLAGAVPLAGQTTENPNLVVHQNLVFAHQVGATVLPTSQTIRVYSAPNGVAFTATVTTQTGGGWLAVNNGLTYTGNTGVAGQNDLVVTVAPGLGAGTYTGTITVTSGGTTVPVSVTLNISPNPVVRLEPSSLVSHPVEAGRTSSITVNVGSSGAVTQYGSEVVSTTPATGWLTVAPNFGTTGTTTTLIVDGSRIPENAGLAVALVRFTSTGGGQTTMPISVVMTPGAQVQVSPTIVTFPFQLQFTAPTARSVNITSSTQTQLTYTATITTAAPWLTLSNTAQSTPGTLSVTGTTPGSLWLIPNVAAVAQQPATHEATIRIETATGSVQNITARLQVSNQPQLTLTQDAAAFVYTLGGTVPSAQTISVGTTSFPQSLTITPTYTTGGEWFTVTPPIGTTPQSVTITVDPNRLAQLAAGTYTGSVRVQSSSSEVTIPVSLTVSGSALISVEPLTLAPFTWQAGQPTPPERTLIIRSTDTTDQPFTVNVEYGTGASGWLVLSATSGSTGTTGTVLRLNVNTTTVATPGTYEATVVIQPTGVASAPAVRVPVRYTLTGSAAVTATPASIIATQNGTTPPAAVTLNLASQTQGLTYIANANQSWIKLSPTSGSIPGAISVSFDSAELAVGDHSGSITITVGGAQTIQVPVTLRVQAASTLQVSAQTLTFNAAQGGAAPAAQPLNLTSTGPAINWTATASSGTGNANWLRIDPASGTTPGAISVSVVPTGLAPGSYTGAVTITATNASNATTTVNVNLTVTAPASPQIRAVVNAASGLPRGVSPGMLATLFGSNMAPTTATSGTITNGMLATTLAEVQVLFDDVAAPILYAGPGGGQDQINVVVPYGVGGRQSTSVVVSYRGVRSSPITYQVFEASPGIFTVPSGGSGQAAVLNENNSVNAAANPARRGQIIQIFATGEGLVTPAVREGQVIPPNMADLRRPILPVQVRLGDATLTPEYAGSAPGAVSGAFQVNVRIPANFPVTAAQNVPLTIVVGNGSSQTNVTVAVAP